METTNNEVLTEITENENAEVAENSICEENSIPEALLTADEERSTDEADTPEEKSPSAEELLEELRVLREELAEKKRAFEKMSRDIGEFETLFPEKNVNEIPDSVWESVKTGIPLAAAYALYERKNAIRIDAAKVTNLANSARTTGPIGKDVTENYYTPDEVRAMSRAEVKRNYSKILESMKKWN